MFDSIFYHMTLKITFFGVKMPSFCHLLRSVIIDSVITDVMMSSCEIYKPLVVYQYKCMMLSRSKMRYHVINRSIIYFWKLFFVGKHQFLLE